MKSLTADWPVLDRKAFKDEGAMWDKISSPSRSLAVMVLGSTLADDPTRKLPETVHSGHGVHSTKIFAPASRITSASAASSSCFLKGRVPEDTVDPLRASCCAFAWASLADNCA